MNGLFLKIGVIFLGLCFLFIFWINININLIKKNNNNYKLRINQKIINIEIADTFAKKAKGLSNRETLLENNGMLFVYKKPGIYPFWMKDMNFPVDIIWIKEDFHIAEISKNISPNSFPKKIKSQNQVKYILEVNAGFCDKYHIKNNDLIEKMF